MAIALQALDVDVQLMILDVLSQEASRSLLNVALSSRTLYHLSRRFIYRDIHLTFNRSRRDINGRLIRQLLANHDLSSKVQQLRILWAPSAKLQPGEGSKEEFELLGQLLPKLTGLRAFVWDAQYPILSWLLEALQRHHPKCRLYNHHPASQDSARTLSHLRASPCLFSLDVTLAAGQFEAHHELHRILITASNLTDLTVTSPWSSSNVLPILKQGDSERLRLRSLELYGPRLDEFKLLPVVWSMLERLSLDTLLFDPNIIPQLPELRFLKLRVRGHGNTMYLGSMLQGCQKLETLDLTGCLGDFQIAAEGFWKNVAKSLIKLRLHEEDARNRAAEARNRAVAPSRIIELIAAYCPKLHSLSFDLECNGQEWPHTTLKCIAERLWFLVHLEIDILIREPQHDCPTYPKATLDSVPEIWRYLWQQTLNCRVRKEHFVTRPHLRSLDLIAGSSRPPPDPWLRPWQVFQQRFTFDLSDRDDEARLGIANVKCTEVEALLSKLPSSKTRNHQQELILKIANERARRGPHIQMPWVTDSEMVRPSPFWDMLDKERFPYRIVH